jgi:hypothetical protein
MPSWLAKVKPVAQTQPPRLLRPTLGREARRRREGEVTVREIREMVRREIIEAMRRGAGVEPAALELEGVAFAAPSELFVVNAPRAGLEKLDVRSVLDGGDSLDGEPIMNWYLAGDGLDAEGMPFREGFYTVVAHQRRGVAVIEDASGRAVAEGSLELCVTPAGSAIAKMPKVSGGIDSASADWYPPHVKICGHVKVQKDGVTVTVRACFEAGL